MHSRVMYVQSGGRDIVLEMNQASFTQAEPKGVIGARPAYDLQLWYTASGKKVTLQNFEAGSVWVTLPYTPAQNERASDLRAVRIDSDGTSHWLENSAYQLEENGLVFTPTSLGIYGVGHSPSFVDTDTHWAKENIQFVTRRGLFMGTGQGCFSPNEVLSRGMFVTALGRLAGVEPEGQASSFQDVADASYYAPYITWAAQNGIVSGTGADVFRPEQPISREEMAVMMKRFAEKTGKVMHLSPKAGTFSDQNQIAPWAREAVQEMQQAGILSGKRLGRFDPTGATTRAEAAAVLERFVKN